MPRQYQLNINGSLILIFVWSEGPYTIEALPSSPGFSYIAGADGVNAVGYPGSEIRAIWENHVATFITNELNKQYPPKS